MPSPLTDAELREMLQVREKSCTRIREELAKRKNKPVSREVIEPSPECQGAHDTAVSADAEYWDAVTAANNALANEQTKDLNRQAAWEAYWDCESP